MTSIRYNARRERLRVGISPIKLLLITLPMLAVLAGALWFSTQVVLGEIDVSDSRRGPIFALMAPVIIPMSVVLALQFAGNLVRMPPSVRASRGEFIAQDFMGTVRIPAEQVAAVGIETVGKDLHLRFVHHAEEDRGGPVGLDGAPPGELWRFKAPYLKEGAPRTEEAVDALSRFLEPRRLDREEAKLRYMRARREKNMRFLGWRLAYGAGVGIGLLILYATWEGGAPF